jgi:hypothetical protein
MSNEFERIVDGVAEQLCWSFRVHGRVEPTHEPARSRLGPVDPDRHRRLRCGETFLRLDRSGHPRVYQGLSWQPKEPVGVAPRSLGAREEGS